MARRAIETPARLLTEACASDAPDSLGTRDFYAILSKVTGRPVTSLVAWPDRELPEGQSEAFLALWARRQAGEPLAHLIGECEFWSLRLSASPSALIPRPDTELLVELALADANPEHEGTLLDLGTGSGAIALAFALERPRWKVTGSDVSEPALRQASTDRDRLGLTNVSFLEHDWHHGLGALGGPYDLVVSNPPYIDRADRDLAPSVAAYEPPQALFAAANGLAELEWIAECAPTVLAPDGWLLMEHGWKQQDAVIAGLEQLGYRNIEGHTDLAGRPRAVRARRPAQERR